TGASTGIGYELARLFARDGYGLVLISRDLDRLRKVKTELEKTFRARVHLVRKDLSDPSAPDEVFSELQTERLTIDILVNNAGFGVHGTFAETDIREEIRMIQLHIASLTHLTKLFLTEMIKHGGGRILNVASTAAYQPGPLMAVYYASKAYVLSFSEALANELKGGPVSLTVLNPGATRTEFQKRAGFRPSGGFNRFWEMDAPTVAEAGYRGLMAGRPTVTPGWMNRLVLFLGRLGTRSAAARAVRRLQEKRRERESGV
ncbi:MAG TPA: SDR family oxidoreductase, partial [Nitrospiria bacterium]|nr:SDR family oxidoreductase [Nitrospiria bacterium]